LSAKGERNLHDLGDAYVGLEDAIERIEAARVCSPAADAAVELRRNLKIALVALVQLEYSFRQFKSGLLIANGDWSTSLGDLFLGRLIGGEKDWRSES